MELKDALKEYLFECELKNYSKKTLKGYRNNNLYLFAFLLEYYQITQIEQVSLKNLKQFMQWQMKKGRKETYLNGLNKTFRSFFKYLHEEGYIKENPTSNLNYAKEPKNVINTFSDAEVKRMLNAFQDRDYLSMRNHAIVSILFDTGMRTTELCTLKNSNVRDFDILIFGKGYKERYVGKSPYLSKTLLKYERVKAGYFECKNVKYDNYFLSRTGRPLTVEAIENIIKIAGQRAGVSSAIRCSPHTLRHYFAQAQLRNGIDVYSLSRLLGHTDIKITQRYLQGLKDEDVVERSIKTSPLMNL